MAVGGCRDGYRGRIIAIRTLVNRLELERRAVTRLLFRRDRARAVRPDQTWLHGSGFLAVYDRRAESRANSRFRRRRELSALSAEGLSWLAQIAMYPSRWACSATPASVFIGHRAACAGRLRVLFLILVARPVAVYVCLRPVRHRRCPRPHSIGFIGPCAGAVSLLLRAYCRCSRGLGRGAARCQR
jgi:NhaP-type Na+/H+ and K+/H+ antiporter